MTQQNWSGRRESNPYYQLGKVNTALFIFNTYKTAQEKYACMLRIPCMQCLICVSLRDVLRDVSCTNFTSLEAAKPRSSRPNFVVRPRGARSCFESTSSGAF